MSFDWTQYLTLARILADPEESLPNEEARSRTAISRAYYAALLTAENFLRARRKVKSRNRYGIHSYVPDTFLRGPSKAWKKVGNKLNQLKDARHRADYEDEFKGLDISTGTALRQAREVIEVLEDL